MNIDPTYYGALILICYIGLLTSLIMYAAEFENNMSKIAGFLAILMFVTPLCISITSEMKEEQWVRDNCKRVSVVTIGKDGPVEQYDCGDKQYKRE